MVKDQVIPGDNWKFDADVTAVFDDMLARSIPQYEEMRQLIFSLGGRFIQPKTSIVDMGASRGESSAALIEAFCKYASQNRFHLIDISEPMLEVMRQRFEQYIAMNSVVVSNMDLRNEFPQVDASLVLSVLTLQFTPIEYRLQILKRVYDSLVSGGAFILVEKILGATATIDAMMVKIYYVLKAANGYTDEQIERKRLSLEGVLVPVTARWNEEMLHNTGFIQVDCFWRWMNFAGWVAIKG